MSQFREFVKEELCELDSKDPNTLFDCIRDNLIEMGVNMCNALDIELMNEIEIQLERDYGIKRNS